MMEIENIHPMWWELTGNPKSSRGKIVSMALFPSSGWICLWPRIPGFQDSTPHLPGTADGEPGAKKPESHSWAKNCSQLPSAFRFPVQKTKSPVNSSSDLLVKYQLSCLFCSEELLSMRILEFLTGKINAGLQPSLICCVTAHEGVWSLPVCSWFVPSPIPWIKFLKNLGWLKPNHRNTSHNCSVPLIPKALQTSISSWNSSGQGNSVLQSHFAVKQSAKDCPRP